MSIGRRLMNIIELPPGSISVANFSNKVRSQYNGVSYDAASLRTVEQLDRAYHRIDPLHPLMLPDRDATQLVMAFDMGAAVVESALDGHSGQMNTKQRDKALNLCGELLLDKATVALSTSDPNYKDLAVTSVMQSGKRLYKHHSIGSLLGAISARTTGIYIEAKRIESTVHQEHAIKVARQTLLRKRIAGVAMSGVQHMHHISEVLRVGKGELGNERGRFMEMTAFAQKVMDWSGVSNPAQAYVRFALDREDRPRSTNVPRRSFDLLTYEGDGIVPVQVKVGGNSDYHESIAIWHPARPDDVMESIPLVVDTFETAIDANADYLDVRNARSLISTQFLQEAPRRRLKTHAKSSI
jgi:hypothetical protein